MVTSQDRPVLRGTLGRGLPQLVGGPVQGDCPPAGVCLRWGAPASLPAPAPLPALSWPGLAELTITQEGSCFTVQWTVQQLQLAEDCVGSQPVPLSPVPD